MNPVAMTIINYSSDFNENLNTTKFKRKFIHLRRQILDSSKHKDFADDNFKFDENGRKLSKRVENTVGKGEIARYKQFLLFPLCFQKTCRPAWVAQW